MASYRYNPRNDTVPVLRVRHPRELDFE